MSASLPQNVGAHFALLNPPMDPYLAGRIDPLPDAPEPRALPDLATVGSALAKLNPPVSSRALATPCEAAGKVVTE